jgi:hypothetical protein
MKHYLSTLAYSGLLSIGALCGSAAFAGSIPNPVPDIAPTVNAAGGTWNLTCTAKCDPSGLQPAVLVGKPGDPGGGVQLVRGGMGGGGIPHGGGFGGFHGGGGFGGFHGGGGFGGFHGMGGGFPGMGGFRGFDRGFHGMGGFHGRHFVHGRRFRNDNFFFDNGGAFFGFGLPLWYSYCDPYYYSYYGVCYPGY